jgi:ParB family chromosome partitioning protein
MATSLTERIARQAAGATRLDLDPTGRDEPRLQVLPLAALDPDPRQPRRDLGNVTDMALSIAELGLLQPIVVELPINGRYRILAGQRRFAACRHLGWQEMPCIVRSVEEQSRLALQIVENVHRKNLEPVEEAEAIRRLMDEFNLSQREVARRLGRSAAAVNQILQILQLPTEILESARNVPNANKSVLLEIAKEPELDRQQAMWRQAEAGELTVRKARRAPTRRAAPPTTSSVTLFFEGARVSVEFESGDATPDRIRTALTAALNDPSLQG